MEPTPVNLETVSIPGVTETTEKFILTNYSVLPDSRQKITKE